MSLTHQDGDLRAFATQGLEHLGKLRQLIGRPAPPELGELKDVTSSTRDLRGSASLLGLDAFQGFLGRLFHLLEDVVASEVPWSMRLERVLAEAIEFEARYLQALEVEDPPLTDADVERFEEHLGAWHRREARRFEEPAGNDVSQRGASQSAASGTLESEVSRLVEAWHTVRDAAGTTGLPEDLLARLDAMLDEMTAWRRDLRAVGASGSKVPSDVEVGLRNHCEGGLRHLVEAAAQEVLDEARESGVRLALRATGAMDAIEDELGGALLEVLRHLWSDSLAMQAATGTATIDTVVRPEEARLVVEIRDPRETQDAAAGPNGDDVLGRYPGLRRSRPLIESLQGIVDVEPADRPGCRFHVVLPRTVARMQATVVRIGAHEVALAPSAIERVLAFSEVRPNQDRAGAFVERRGRRYPVLNLGVVLGDESYDELVRERVLVVGSFERRAALFASGTPQTVEGAVEAAADGPWAGTLRAATGSYRVLDVGKMLGRRATTALGIQADAQGEASQRTAGSILVVMSSDVERSGLKGLLEERAYRVVSVRTADEARSVLESQPVDLIVADLRLPEMNAQQIAEHRRRTGRFADVPMLLVLSQPGEQSDLVAQQLGAQEWIRSPVPAGEMYEVVERLRDGP